MIYDTYFIIKGIFIRIFEFLPAKFFSGIAIPLFTLAFGIHNNTVIKVLFFLIILDFITGVASAISAGEKITSRKTVRTAFKVTIYGLLLAAGHLVEQILPVSLFIEQIVSSFLALTEFISILENTGKLGYGIPRKLLTQLQKIRGEK